jgi:hypothetical protein
VNKKKLSRNTRERVCKIQCLVPVVYSFQIIERKKQKGKGKAERYITTSPHTISPVLFGSLLLGLFVWGDWIIIYSSRIHIWGEFSRR